jgi:hypothetical protein
LILKKRNNQTFIFDSPTTRSKARRQQDFVETSFFGIKLPYSLVVPVWLPLCLLVLLAKKSSMNLPSTSSTTSGQPSKKLQNQEKWLQSWSKHIWRNAHMIHSNMTQQDSTANSSKNQQEHFLGAMLSGDNQQPRNTTSSNRSVQYHHQLRGERVQLQEAINNIARNQKQHWRPKAAWSDSNTRTPWALRSLFKYLTSMNWPKLGNSQHGIPETAKSATNGVTKMKAGKCVNDTTINHQM